MIRNIFWLLLAIAVAIALVWRARRRRTARGRAARPAGAPKAVYVLTPGSVRSTAAHVVGGAKAKVADKAGLNRPRSADALVEMIVDTAERKARSCPGGIKDMPDAIHASLSAAQFEYVGKYLAVVRDQAEAGIRRRAAHNGWPAPSTKVTITLDDAQAAPVRVTERFSSPFDPVNGGTMEFTDRQEPAEIVIDGSEPDGPAVQPVLSDWFLTMADGTYRHLELDRWYNIGAAPSNDIVVDDGYVSGCHVGLCATGTVLLIEDGLPQENKPSTNGTTINGIPIQRFTLNANRGAEMKLGPHTVISIGHVHETDRQDA
ncbi:FHA domain-containing protein [Rhodococcus rhodochrous]|uniref:FHA domain-containing protein n=1 Tax=Rhodococcus rhodochrous TaxID=1829 RepID=UPI001E4109DD|nr:FHA domain-containing protein [Rhodococcus rhodochrous]MCB8913569.1 FHA domain-containing protein [Rhodococcus rhodochrous]